MNRHFEQRHRRDRDLQQSVRANRPAVRAERAEAFPKFAEQELSLLFLLIIEPGRHEVIQTGERSQERRKRRAVVLIATFGQDTQNAG